MSIELKAGDYFRRDMGEERYRAVVEKLIEAGMDRHGGEVVGCEVDQAFFGWSVKTGGLFHSSSTPGQSRHLTGRLLAFEDVFPQTPLADPNLSYRDHLAQVERAGRALLEACRNADGPEPAPKHWDGTGEPQVGQVVSADPGRAKVMLEPDVDGWAVVQNAAGQWRRLRLDGMRASPDVGRAAGIAALDACLDVNFLDPDKADQLYGAGVRANGAELEQVARDMLRDLESVWEAEGHYVNPNLLAHARKVLGGKA